MPPETDAYPCPFCAESIKREAVTCRFCQRDALFDVLLELPPPREDLANATREIYGGSAGKTFPSYRALRERMEKPRSPLLAGVSRAEAEALQKILSAHKGRAAIRLREPPPEPEAVRRNRLAQALNVSVILLCAGALAYFLHRRPPAPPAEPTGAAPAFPAPPPPEIPAPRAEVAAAPALHPEPAVAKGKEEVRGHLRSLIHATAMLSGGNVTGSAFFIHRDGYLVTNHHVVRNMPAVAVHTSDGKTRPGRVVREDASYDLALVKADGGPYPVLKLGDATALEQGETVWTIGAPHGLSFTVTKGVVSFVGRRMNGRAFLQSDVAINPGNSGGPMVNERGEVIGVNNFIISNAVGLNFAIPINYVTMGASSVARDIVETLPDNETVATWRSWEEGAERRPAADGSPPPQRFEASPSDLSLRDLTRKQTQLREQFQNKRGAAEAEIARLRAELAAVEGRYYGQSASISSETETAGKISSLRQEILRREVALLSDTIAYAGEDERLSAQIQSAADPDSAEAERARSEILQLRQTKESAKRLLEAKRQEQAAEEERRY